MPPASTQRRQRESAKGLTLLEALVALVVLAIGLLGLSMYQGHLTKSNALAKQRSEATMLAEQKIAQSRSYRLLSEYTALAAGNDSITGTNAQYARSWAVGACANPVGSSARCKSLTVNVGWTGSGGAAESISLTTDIVANNPARTGDLVVTATGTPPPPNPNYSCSCKKTGGNWSADPPSGQDARCPALCASSCGGATSVTPTGGNTQTCTVQP